uniref:Uncharacterized protein n=1 Tax=Wolbachia endosymbiont of Aleurodicus floccissimus TaxID=2152762 RepID=A0A3B0IWY9_9RICK
MGANILLAKAVDNAAPIPAPVTAIKPGPNHSIFVSVLLLVILLINIIAPAPKAATNPILDGLLVASREYCTTSLSPEFLFF